MTKLLLVIALIFTIACGYAQRRNNISVYHIAFAETIDTSARTTYFNQKTIRYVGKMTFNKETGKIVYQFLDNKDCKKLEDIINDYKATDEEGYILSLEYSLFYEKKPEEQKITDRIEYLPFDRLWLLGRSATYGDKDFWIGFETRGFIDYSTYGYYRVIDSNVGEKYFENKNAGTGDIELQKALKLGPLESFWPN